MNLGGGGGGSLIKKIKDYNVPTAQGKQGKKRGGGPLSGKIQGRRELCQNTGNFAETQGIKCA